MATADYAILEYQFLGRIVEKVSRKPLLIFMVEHPIQSLKINATIALDYILADRTLLATGNKRMREPHSKRNCRRSRASCSGR